ncbi:MAG: tetratricopeptide repeat protein, partial [Burkholderiaceae bacterium]|nr:tetratricopeptide repeat protein [Burkholderiaceae bacterium]
LPAHEDDAEILRGGLFLSYGLHKQAGEVFAALIERGAPPAVRDRAWFYLAKIRYQRGLLAQAEEALARIGGALPAPLAEERTLLAASLLMARGAYAEAAKLLAAVKDGAGLYARFNLGVAMIKSGDTAGGMAVLDQVGTAPADSEEYRSLRDRANLALGFAALQNEDPARARTYLERVRLQGLHANRALLAFGWAAAGLKQTRAALVPWTELAARTPVDAAVLEAKLAVPYAFAELGALRQALDGYQQALAAFERESAALDESIAAIRAGRLTAGLLARNPGEEMGWFWSIQELPEMPHAAHLAHVLAQHEFQEAFKNWRDLVFLDRNLRQWQEKLGALQDMLENRRQAFAARLPAVREQERALGVEDLARRHAALQTEFTQAAQRADGAGFADARELAAMARIEAARALLARLPASPERDEAAERLRRIEGALTWQLAQQAPVRRWEAQKGLREIEQGLAHARAAHARLAQAQREEPARFERFAARIDELAQRLQALLPQVAALTVEQEAHLQTLAVAELERQKERLVQYANHAHFAVAQILDRASVAQETSRGGAAR